MAKSLTTAAAMSSARNLVLLLRFAPPSSNCYPSSVKRHFSAAAALTPLEATSILRANEWESKEGQVAPPIKGYDRNVLASNDPIEDSYAEGILKHGKGGMMFGVFDGHSGPSCGQVVSKRLLSYVAASLLSADDLRRHVAAVKSGQDSSHYRIVTASNDDSKFVPELQALYDQSYLGYLQSLCSSLEATEQREEDDKEDDVSERLQRAFCALDDDLSAEALTGSTTSRDLREMTRAVAACGAVAAVALVVENDLTIASTGDCNVVLGTLSENNTWVARKLTTDHNTDNKGEVQRILREHPGEKERNIIRGDRLMGMLAPLRAFGDFRFKWPAETILKELGDKLGATAVAQNYLTPPYLTAKPEITRHKLTPRDRFMVIGSDGLWDMMTPMQVIRLVGEHMSGKITLTPLQVTTQQKITLEEMAVMLRHRQKAMRLKPTDINAATHLIRNALGGSVYGIDHAKLAQTLELPQDMVRMFRDDITITVVYFDKQSLM